MILTFMGHSLEPREAEITLRGWLLRDRPGAVLRWCEWRYRRSHNRSVGHRCGISHRGLACDTGLSRNGRKSANFKWPWTIRDLEERRDGNRTRPRRTP